MAEEEKQPVTEDATEETLAGGNGAETEQVAETKDAPQYTQAEVDARISAALKAREEKANKEAEEKRRADEHVAAIQAGKFEEALKITQAELDVMKADGARQNLQIEGTKVLTELGLANHASHLIAGAQTIDEIMERGKAFKAEVEQATQNEVKKRLDTGPPRTPSGAQKHTDVTPDKMNKEQFEQFKKSMGVV